MISLRYILEFMNLVKVIEFKTIVYNIFNNTNIHKGNINNVGKYITCD